MSSIPTILVDLCCPIFCFCVYHCLILCTFSFVLSVFFFCIVCLFLLYCLSFSFVLSVFFFCIVCLFLLYCLSFSFVLSVFFRLTASNYPFGISKLFLKQQSTILFMFYLEDNFKWRGFSPQNVKTKTNDDISMISTVTRLKILSN
jgi:hypothetical protein